MTLWRVCCVTRQEVYMVPQVLAARSRTHVAASRQGGAELRSSWTRPARRPCYTGLPDPRAAMLPMASSPGTGREIFTASLPTVGLICRARCSGLTPQARRQLFTVSPVRRRVGGDGSGPEGGVVRDASGNLYGVT